MRIWRRLCTLLLVLGAAGTATAQRTSLKIATIAPDGSVWMEEARASGDELERRTDGRVRLRFYPGGTMGSDELVLRKMRIGQLHGGVVLAGALGSVDRDMELYNLPLLFRSDDEVDYVRSRMDGRLIAEIADDGLLAFGLVETGFVYLMSSKPTRSFEDLGGRKAWIPEGDPISKAIADAVGLSPVPLAISDVLTGLQTGLVDTVAAPPVGAVALQWFTKASYVTDLPISYVYGSIILSDSAFERLDEADQVIVREVLSDLSNRLDHRARDDNRDAREALAKQGVTFVSPTDAARVRWAEVAAEATRTLIERNDYDRGLLDQINRLLEELRARQGGAAGGT